MKSFTAAAASGAAALLWVALAWRNPSSTYHFAPLIVAAAWPWLARTNIGPTTVKGAMPSVGGAAGLALLAGAVLLAGDKLRGPTFWSEARQPSQVVLEIFLATLLGSLIGFTTRVQGSHTDTTSAI